jgi:hypothetical protein
LVSVSAFPRRHFVAADCHFAGPGLLKYFPNAKPVGLRDHQTAFADENEYKNGPILS